MEVNLAAAVVLGLAAVVIVGLVLVQIRRHR